MKTIVQRRDLNGDNSWIKRCNCSLLELEEGMQMKIRIRGNEENGNQRQREGRKWRSEAEGGMKMEIGEGRDVKVVI